jgi:hypothetical protein
LAERRQSSQVWQPQLGQIGLPSARGQRRRRNTFSAPRSDIRITLPGFSERAAADNRKCRATGLPQREHKANIAGGRTKVNRCGGCYMVLHKDDKEWYLYATRAGLLIGVANHRRDVSLNTISHPNARTIPPAPPPFSSIVARDPRGLPA